MVHALRLTGEVELEDVRITSDLQLVIRQIQGFYSTNEPSLQKYKQLVEELSAKIKNLEWRHISRNEKKSQMPWHCMNDTRSRCAIYKGEHTLFSIYQKGRRKGRCDGSGKHRRRMS